MFWQARITSSRDNGYVSRGNKAIRRALTAGLCAALILGTSVQANTLYFCWRGDSGYTMTGAFSYPEQLGNKRIITENDVTTFEITGYLEGERIGSWNLEQLTDETSWLLRYDTRRELFPFLGDYGVYQMWNANGAVNDCGVPGFGFNAGNGGQDVCVDNTFVVSSTVPWDTPLRTQTTFPSVDCSGPSLLGRLEDLDLPWQG